MNQRQIRWTLGGLYFGALDHNAPRYWRLVAQASRRLPEDSSAAVSESVATPFEADADMVYLLEVDPLKTPTASRMPMGVTAARASAQLTPAPECVRLPFMEADDASLSEMAKLARDARFEKVRPIFSAENLSAFLNDALRPDLLKRHAAAIGMATPNLRRLITKYMWYGCDANALLDLNSLTGR